MPPSSLLRCRSLRLMKNNVNVCAFTLFSMRTVHVYGGSFLCYTPNVVCAHNSCSHVIDVCHFAMQSNLFLTCIPLFFTDITIFFPPVLAPLAIIMRRTSHLSGSKKHLENLRRAQIKNLTGEDRLRHFAGSFRNPELPMRPHRLWRQAVKKLANWKFLKWQPAKEVIYQKISLEDRKSRTWSR